MKKAIIFTLLLLIIQLATAITFDDIQYWIGEGENEAALVIDWEDSLEPTTLIWGYRWDGTKNGQEMLSEIMATDSRLSGDASLPSEITYDLNNDGTIDSNDHSENGDMTDNNFWSYYIQTADEDSWSFATVSHAGHILADGDWAGWSYIADWSSTPYPEIDEPTAAEPPITELGFDELIVWAGEGANEAMFVVDFNSGDDPQSYAWGYRWDGNASGENMMIALSELDPRLEIAIASGFLNDITLDLDLDGTDEYVGFAGNPDYWSTWSKPENGEWNWNNGVGTTLENNARFGCSYFFTPESTQPDNPVAIEELPIIGSAPVAFADNAKIGNTVVTLLYPLFNDIDEDADIDLESLELSTETIHGTIQINNNGTLSYTPEPDFVGYDNFSYTISDYQGNTSEIADFTLEIVLGFDNVVGTEGCAAIENISTEFVAWATGVEIERGPINISNPNLGLASYGIDEAALGEAEGTSMEVVSLGDGGTAILTFANPITDEEGADFAVFENSFSNSFLELAFVEVSSDGENFYRFPATSLTQTIFQVGDAGMVQAGNINNLAGKYIQGWGTPFDLAELSDEAGLDISTITHVKIIDVIGSINLDYATYDQYGNIINDPWITESASSGFDLDGVGIIHSGTIVDAEETPEFDFALHKAYPNPFSLSSTRSTGISISFSIAQSENVAIKIYNVKGQQVATICDSKFDAGKHQVRWDGKNSNEKTVGSGVYFYKMQSNNFTQVKRMILLK